MRYQKPERITISKAGVFYGGKAIPLGDLKYVYISGANSVSEYGDNLGCYSVTLRNSHDSYLLLETQDKGEAKKMLKDIKRVLGNRRGIKLYNNSAIVNLEHLVDVKVSKPGQENSNKVKLYMDNGRVLRVFRSAFEMPARIYASTIKADINNYSKPSM